MKYTKPPLTFEGQADLLISRGLDADKKELVSKLEAVNYYDLSFGVLETWLKTLNSIRNICAHHGRLWNRELGLKPLIPDHKHPEWHNPVEVPNHRVFCVLTIQKYLMKYVAPQSNWPQRFYDLLDEYPDIPLKQMGFPENWKECPIWK